MHLSNWNERMTFRQFVIAWVRLEIKWSQIHNLRQLHDKTAEISKQFTYKIVIELSR